MTTRKTGKGQSSSRELARVPAGPFVVQDTSTNIQRKQVAPAVTVAGAVGSVIDAITNCINVWNRERQITKRVRAECQAAIKIARAEVDKIEHQKKAYFAMLASRAKDRMTLERQLDKMWHQVEIWDEKFRTLDLEEMKKHQDLLQTYLEFKKDTLGRISSMFEAYYQPQASPRLIP